MDNSPNTNTTSAPKKNKAKRFALISLLVLVAAWLIYYFICGLAYSEGTRSGILTKVSKKGFVFKTYEGELIIGGLNQGDGALMPATVFKFSVTDKPVYDKLEADQGKKVILHYKQVIKNFFWQGETDYFVHAVTFVN
jgi:hypothetical protein